MRYRAAMSPRHVVSTALAFAVSVSLAACGGSVADDGTSSGDDELRAAAPSPFALQYVGAYAPDPGSTTAVARVVLERDGHYTMVFAGRRPEHGSWHASRTAKALALGMVLVTRGQLTSMRIDTYDGHATLVRNGETTALHATETVGPNETLCDDSGGSWADDDADPATGLFCLCATGRFYVPSEGGCVP